MTLLRRFITIFRPADDTPIYDGLRAEYGNGHVHLIDPAGDDWLAAAALRSHAERPAAEHTLDANARGAR